MNFLSRWKSLRSRQLEPEWMDAPDADPAELERSLRFIRRINAALGYTRTTLGHLQRLAADWPADRPMSVLDVATGSGDVPRAILQRWPDRAVSIVGIDLHAATIKTAVAQSRSPELRFLRADATSLPFADRSFDFVLCSMFLHHLDETTTVSVLKEIARVARGGIVIADLLRCRRAYGWITLFTLGSTAMVRHDARSSVAAAHTVPEPTALLDRAGLPSIVATRHFGHRVVLSGRVG